MYSLEKTSLKIYDDIGVAIPEILLPAPGIDLTKWAVIACDQFTSQPEYWREASEIVGDAPSTLNLIFPEVLLDAAGREERIRNIHVAMGTYLRRGLLEPREGMILVERRVAGRIRRGLMLCLDLERYDYNKGSTSLIRATEGTILERLPPRMSIREGAALELPHILVLIDDAEGSVIEPLTVDLAARAPLYDFDLMRDSGHLAGYGVDQASQDQALMALRRLASPNIFGQKYGVALDTPALLFAMGDGNHSLATAKAVWEKLKPRLGMNHPARYALVEIENIHDGGLDFEPIHRLLFGVKRDLLAALAAYFSPHFTYSAFDDPETMARRVDSASDAVQMIGLVQGGTLEKFTVLEIARPSSNLAVGTLQPFLDDLMDRSDAEKIDYVHGKDVVIQLAAQPGNAGFYLPKMGKSSLFKTVILDGALPRKTFSMGQAREKRFYMESRRIAQDSRGSGRGSAT
jgi:hypothetical protein